MDAQKFQASIAMRLLTFEEWYELNRDDYPCKADPNKVGMRKALQQKSFTLAEIICKCDNHNKARAAYEKQIEDDKKKLAMAGITIR